jgi:hypothetical protein
MWWAKTLVQSTHQLSERNWTEDISGFIIFHQIQEFSTELNYKNFAESMIKKYDRKFEIWGRGKPLSNRGRRLSRCFYKHYNCLILLNS